MATEQELQASRRAHAEHLHRQGSAAYPRFQLNEAQDRACAEMFQYINDEAKRAALPMEADVAEDAVQYTVAGRLVAKRGPFFVLRTRHGDVQALVRPDQLEQTQAQWLKSVDLADHIAVCGALMRTKTGAAALRVRDYQHVGKALLPPPAKWHGLKDIEKRYRERYVDLFANPDIAQVFRARALIVQQLRAFLDARGFLEVETPMLHAVRGGATAKPFLTHHNALDMPLYLRIAPELYLKRLLVGGLERVYEIGRAFRNEGVSTRHNPEFTLIEFYQAFATCEELISLTESMLRQIDAVVCEHFPQFASDRSFALHAHWQRVTMRQSIIDVLQQQDSDALLTPAHIMDATLLEKLWPSYVQDLPASQQGDARKQQSYGRRIFFLFESLVETKLTQLYRSDDGQHSLPVFITEYPFEVSPLARRCDDRPDWVNRFELFIDGREVANAFDELNDPDDQAERFRAQLTNRSQGDDEAMDFDDDYIRALQHGMPPAAGFGLGVDRLVMLLCQQASIRDVLLFPLMRSEGA